MKIQVALNMKKAITHANEINLRIENLYDVDLINTEDHKHLFILLLF